LRAINEKLVRRHPHVFGGATARTASDVTRHWEEIKLAEKARKAEAREGSVEASLLDGVSRAQPALAEAQQLGTKAGKAGFDWPEASGVMAKIHEEIEEIAGTTDPQDIEEELGDLLLALASLARFHKVDAEQSLRRANAKFRRRFAYVESELGKPLTDATLEEMEAKWQEAKRREAQQRNHRPDAAALKQTQP
jgi:MazG family protein